MYIPDHVFSTLPTIYLYGLCLLFAKAWIAIVFTAWIYKQLEFQAASKKHILYSFLFLSLLLLPPMSAIVPSHSLPILPSFSGNENTAAITFESNADTPSPDNESISHALKYVLITFYILVCMTIAIRLIAALVRIAGITINAEYIQSDKWQASFLQLSDNFHTRLLFSTQTQSPFSWGFFNPVIVLPKTALHWDEAHRSMTLAHEHAHIKRRDWIIQLMAELAYILFWPIPGIKQAKRNLSLEAENSTDDSVLKTGVSDQEYAQHLLEQATSAHFIATVPLAKNSELRKRIEHILNRYDRSLTNKRKLKIALVGFFGLLLPLASLQATSIHYTTSNNTKYTHIISFKGLNISRGATIVDTTKEKKENLRDRLDQLNLDDFLAPNEPKNITAHVFSANYSSTKNKTIEILPVALKGFNTDSKALVFVQGPMPLVSIMPIYPKKAVSRKIEGYVITQFDISASGKTKNHRIIQSSPKYTFNQSVLTALKRYRYKPQEVDGQAVETIGVTNKFVFSLDGETPVYKQEKPIRVRGPTALTSLH